MLEVDTFLERERERGGERGRERSAEVLEGIIMTGDRYHNEACQST